MDIELKQIMNRIICGYQYINEHVIDIPSSITIAESDLVYNKCIQDNRFESLIDQQNIESLLLIHKLWTLKDKSDLESMPKRLKAAKYNLYMDHKVPSKLKKLQRHVNFVKKQQNDLLCKKSVFDRYTLQNLAEESQERYVYSKSILNKKYKSVELNGVILDRVISKIRETSITTAQYRAIARSEEWQNIWSISKLDIFRTIGEEQRHLVNYTNFYESIFKNKDKPSQLVIDNDDILDGWTYYIKEKIEREEKEQGIAGKSKKEGNEQFIMVKDKEGNVSQEDIDAVHSMNNTRAKVIMKKIHNETQKNGVANEFHIQEIQQDAAVNLK